MAQADDRSRLLRAYDEQLRGENEMLGAMSVDIDGPILRGRFGQSRGFVTYRSLGGISDTALDRLIEQTIAYYEHDTDVLSFEWKTRGHDLPDLTDRLHARGLQAEECETVMIGDAEPLAAPVDLPADVSLRRIDPSDPEQALADVQRMLDMQAQVFGRSAFTDADAFTADLIAHPDRTEAWIAECEGEVICTGRLEIVPDTAFAGLWGGATRADWRRRGIYRALTAARARSAAAKGVHYLHSDSTDHSRPILERSGLLAVTTTTPFVWHRDRQALLSAG